MLYILYFSGSCISCFGCDPSSWERWVFSREWPRVISYKGWKI